MFRMKTLKKADYWGFGGEISVQYDWETTEQIRKRPTGIAVILCCVTREFRLGYFWG